MAKPIFENNGIGTFQASKLRQSDSGEDGARQVPAEDREEEEDDVEMRENERFRTTVLINLASVMERCDEQILPAVYAFIAKSWKATPTELGMLSLARALVQALSSPIGGVAGHMMNRVVIITAGCLIWGTMTGIFATCNSIKAGALVWAVNGLGLAFVIPTGQSLIADYYVCSARGRAFGFLFLTSALGAMLGSLFGTTSGGRMIAGLEGWRVCFWAVATMSILIGLLTASFGTDPRYKSKWNRKDGPPSLSLTVLLQEMGYILRLKTFLIIILQGVMGSIPWQGMVFFTLWLQLKGLPDAAAAGVYAMFLTGTAFGGALGGYLGDRASVISPNHGRIVVSQISVAMGLPMSVLIIKGLPYGGTMPVVVMHLLTFLFFGLVKSWAGPACNNPIFAEIVPPRLRNLIYACDRCFEGALAACAAPLVGLIAQHYFGFKGTAEVTRDPARDLPRARALGNALLLFMIVPWTFCLLAYSGLHFTYKRDKLISGESSTPLEEEEEEHDVLTSRHQV
eukprot:jgi/Botrbrau1/21612/Bobra.43_1s0016.1